MFVSGLIQYSLQILSVSSTAQTHAKALVRPQSTHELTYVLTHRLNEEEIFIKCLLASSSYDQMVEVYSIYSALSVDLKLLEYFPFPFQFHK